MGLFLLCMAIMLNNYRDTRKLGRRLSEAEKEAEIAELKGSIRTYARISALSGDYLSVHVVDPETERYREYMKTRAV